MARATNSLPVPVSPSIRTVKFEPATCWICVDRLHRRTRPHNLAQGTLVSQLVLESLHLAEHSRSSALLTE